MVRTVVSYSLTLILLSGSVLFFVVLRNHNLYIVHSGSMEPTITTGAMIVVEKHQEEPYRANDIITFNNHGQTITHRIVEVMPKDAVYFYRTKGDANGSADSFLITHEQVLGKTMAILPLLGYLLAFLKTKIGFTAAILLPATLVVLQEVKNLKIAWRELSSADKLTA